MSRRGSRAAAVVLCVVTIAAACATDDEPRGTEAARESIPTFHNSSPELEDLTIWAFQRFTLAGLRQPLVASVDFNSSDGRCPGFAGMTDVGPTGVHILVCLDSVALCRRINGFALTPPGKLCMLHELAHAWMSQNLTRETRAAMLELTGLATWDDPDTPWDRRGVEHAAEAVAWGLMDQRLKMERLGEPPCARLHRAFEILTNAYPLVSCDDPAL